MSSITINGITLDPDAQAPVLHAMGLQSRDAANSDFILVQTRSPAHQSPTRRTGEPRGGDSRRRSRKHLYLPLPAGYFY